jgi:hypothetical protein
MYRYNFERSVAVIPRTSSSIVSLNNRVSSSRISFVVLFGVPFFLPPVLNRLSKLLIEFVDIIK